MATTESVPSTPPPSTEPLGMSGYIGIGVAQLLLSFLCVGYIWSIIDGILILTGSPETDADGKPLSP